MKKFNKITRLSKISKLFLLIVGLIIITSCDKDDDLTPEEQLPPKTQTGAQTFGCLINGQPFVPPKLGSNSPRAFYQFARGAYTLGISAGTGGGNEMIAVLVGGIDISGLTEGQYSLIERQSGNFHGAYLEGYEFQSTTNTGDPGKLIVTNFDPQNFIISGTFSFSIKDENGDNIEITEGRFDMNYTN